jgi:class 3 adenylate cyclase
MPLYMDRHETPGASAQEVAQAHARDVSVAAKHGVQFLSYWFDEDHGGVFCFAKAPGKDNLTAVHQESHGLLPNEIISVSEDDVLRFLGGIHDPVDDSELKSPFRTILFTDLEGSTSLLQEVGESEFMVLLTEHDLIIRRALVASRGREIKHTGDGIMASFEDVTGSLDCAVAIQDGFDARAAAGAAPDLRVRIGLAAGQPVRHNDDIFGSAVNLASRICDSADAGRILVSDVVHDLAIEEGYSFGEAGELALKGFTDPTRVFELHRAR